MDDSMVVDASTTPTPKSPIVEAPLKPSLFSDLPKSMQTNSIVHFLTAHPDPLTEAQLEPLFISFSDFSEALKEVQPSSKREGFATIPDVTWADIGALHGTREELHMAIVQPIKRPQLFKSVGISAPCGVLLWGPPGCGKTLLAKAVANESRANFISVKGPELLNKVRRATVDRCILLITSYSTSVRVSAQYDKCLRVHEHHLLASSSSMSWTH